MKNIEKAKIKNLIKAIDKNIKVVFAKRFQCDIDKKIVYVDTTHKHKKDIKIFQKWFENYFNQKLSKKDLFYISLLHEVGHIITFTTELKEERENCYNLIGTKLFLNLITREQANNEYFEIPMELKATEWAKNFYN